ncbi:MAG: hypothetical protein ACXVNM_02180 [Bacteroidia bacterium]
MPLGLKLNTAILICTAFLFRLLFVNINIISSLNTRHNGNSVKSHFSSILKRRKPVDVQNNSSSREYSAIEICEENPNNEDDLSKTNPLILIRILYSFLSNKAVSKSNVLFDFVNCTLSSKKYLAISVLRI